MTLEPKRIRRVVKSRHLPNAQFVLYPDSGSPFAASGHPAASHHQCRLAGTSVDVSVHGFADDGPCLGCLVLQQQQESWSAKPISDATGLLPDRVRVLIQSNGELTAKDIAMIKAAGKLRCELLADVDSFLGRQFSSLWNRAVYSEAVLRAGSDADCARDEGFRFRIRRCPAACRDRKGTCARPPSVPSSKLISTGPVGCPNLRCL